MQVPSEDIRQKPLVDRTDIGPPAFTERGINLVTESERHEGFVDARR